MPSIKYDHALAQAIVNTIREPLLVLDEELRVVAASRSFYRTFKVSPQNTDGRLLSGLGDGQWDISGLTQMLKEVAPDESVLENYEVELVLPAIGRRIMCLNARKVFYESGAHTSILLAFEDITERRAAERERDLLLRDKDMLLQEMQHRVANSLQIIASILLMKARAVSSEETRSHLQDAHKRVLAVAAVQKHLHAAAGNDLIEIRPYLARLCESLAGSMIAENSTISIGALCDDSSVKSNDAVSVGLIVTELVINALKYAFPTHRPDNAILVTYATNASGGWRLMVADNGIGKAGNSIAPPHSGLGTSIVTALADQLGARVESASSDTGLAVSLTHETVRVMPHAATAPEKVALSIAYRAEANTRTISPRRQETTEQVTSCSVIR